MGLIAATATKTLSDNADIPDREILVSGALTMTKIAAKINTEARRTDAGEPVYVAHIVLDGDVNGRTKPVDIIQSDDTKVSLMDVVMVLGDENYQVVSRSIKTREGKPDKIKLQIGWS